MLALEQSIHISMSVVELEDRSAYQQQKDASKKLKLVFVRFHHGQPDSSELTLAARRALEADRALNAIASLMWGRCGGRVVFTRPKNKSVSTKLNGKCTVSQDEDRRKFCGNLRQCRVGFS